MAATVPYYTVDDLEHFPHDGNRYELLDGVLLVTPAPGVPHETVVSRLLQALILAVQVPGHAQVFSHAAVSFPPGTQFEPDILVVPMSSAKAATWQEIRDHWLVVEVCSPSSRIYDRDFKRDNYLRFGAKEVWIVDPDNRTVEVTREIGRSEIVNDAITWRPPALDREVRIQLAGIFADVESVTSDR